MLLDIYHFMANRAEVKQVEDVDFEELVVGQLVESILEFGLLTDKVRPERILELRCEVRGLIWLQLLIGILHLIR